MEIGERIRMERKRAQLSQEELARKAKLSLNAVARLEQGGRTNPHVGTLLQIATALNIPIAELLEEPVPLGESSVEPGATGSLSSRGAPRSLDELLERDGLASRWLTKPNDEFKNWWIEVDRKEAIDRFWQIEAEYRVVEAEWRAILEGTSTVAPVLQEEIKNSFARGLYWARHFGAVAAAPGIEETEGEFYKRQEQGTLRQFKQIDDDALESEQSVENLVARVA